MATKRCTICNLDISVDNFYRDRTPLHCVSYISKCKKCYSTQVSQRKKIQPDLSVQSKICSVCNIEKDVDKYYKSYRHKDGYFKWCNVCHDKKVKNKDMNTKIKRTKEYMIEYNKNKSKDIAYQLKYAIRSNLHSYLRRNIASSKNNNTLKYVGCTIDFLKTWFEYNFDKNMSWSNRGTYWHIDHINPCSSFDLTQQDDIYKCYNWTNLRPLEKMENIIKSNTVHNELIINFDAKSTQFLSLIKYTIEEKLYTLLPEV